MVIANELLLHYYFADKIVKSTKNSGDFYL